MLPLRLFSALRSSRLLSTTCNTIQAIRSSCSVSCSSGLLASTPSALRPWQTVSQTPANALQRHFSSKLPPPIPVPIDPAAPSYTEPVITTDDLLQRVKSLYTDTDTIKHTAPCSIKPFPEGFNPNAQVQQYNVVGSVTGPYKVPRRPVFAIVSVGGSQYKVTPTDLVYVEKLWANVNDVVSLKHVLMIGTARETVVGRPHLPQATVEAVVEEQFRDAKVLNFKKRRRKNSKRLKGHRQSLTALRIVAIQDAGLLEEEVPQKSVPTVNITTKLRRR